MKSPRFTSLVALVAVMAAGALAAAPAAAEDLVSLKGDVKVERKVASDGAVKTVLSEPTEVVPGDRLRFATDYSNDSASAVDNFVVTNPLPAAVTLAADDKAFEVSVDGGKTFGRLADFTVKDAAAGDRQAALADVTHIRWTLARLAPGASGSLSYYAIVR